MIPSPFAFVLLGLAAWRTWHLLSEDAILGPVRRVVLEHRLSTGLAEFMDCAFCLGFWVGFAWTAAFWVWPHGVVVAAVPFAVSAAVALVQVGKSALTG